MAFDLPEEYLDYIMDDLKQRMKQSNVKTECAESKLMWGCYDQRAFNRGVHVVPTIDECPLPPHTLSKDCACHPDIDNCGIYIHHMIQ